MRGNYLAGAAGSCWLCDRVVSPCRRPASRRSSGQPTVQKHTCTWHLYLRPAMSTSADRVAQRAAERVDALGGSLRTAAEWADRT